MGIPFFTTFVNQFLFSSKRPSNPVTLQGANVVIDGFSFICFIYNNIGQDESSQVFKFHELAIGFRSQLSLLKKKCSDLNIVFDGFGERNPRKRIAPQRASSIEFVRDSPVVPRLLHREFTNILNDLEIKFFVTNGEADPFIAEMAKRKKALIVGNDSDYFLYDGTSGYVPLQELDLKTLTGKLYRMNDVFPRMDQRSVALWATAITYDFLSFQQLSDEFEIRIDEVKNRFNDWLKTINCDDEMRQHLQSQYNLFRYIQIYGYDRAYERIRRLIKDDHDEFDRLMENYFGKDIEHSRFLSIDEKMADELNSLYRVGKLDKLTVHILFQKKLPYHESLTNPITRRLLSPISKILLTWFESVVKSDALSKFKDNSGEVKFDLIPSEALPSLKDLFGYDTTRKKRFVMTCVMYALENQNSTSWNSVHRNYRLWLSMLCLGLKGKDQDSTTSKAILIAFILSYLKHILLDDYQWMKGTESKSDKLPEPPYLHASPQEMRKHFSRDERISIRHSLEEAKTGQYDEDIKMELVQYKQIFESLHAINQITSTSLSMPRPSSCFSELFYYLAVRLKQSNDLWDDTERYCRKNEHFVKLTSEICDFVRKTSSSRIDPEENRPE